MLRSNAMLVLEQLFAQLVVVYILHGALLIYSVSGGGGRTLSENHKHRLHAD